MGEGEQKRDGEKPGAKKDAGERSFWDAPHKHPAFWTLLYVLVLVCFGLGTGQLSPSKLAALKASELGDLLAGVAAPMAFFWLVWGYFLQRRELELQREELRGSRAALLEQGRQQEKFAHAMEMQIILRAVDAIKGNLRQSAREIGICLCDMGHFSDFRLGRNKNDINSMLDDELCTFVSSHIKILVNGPFQRMTNDLIIKQNLAPHYAGVMYNARLSSNSYKSEYHKILLCINKCNSSDEKDLLASIIGIGWESIGDNLENFLNKIAEWS